eukprot:COSAG01_NODE_29668_length_632_cov_1.332083_1_plen_119_part_10
MVHKVLPAALYSPAMHWTQPVVLSVSESARPAGHVTQVPVLCPMVGACHVCPARHAMHGVAALLSASICPATHVVHVVAPQPAYVPLLHAMHDVDALESVSAWPAVQKLHPLDPLAAYW